MSKVDLIKQREALMAGAKAAPIVQMFGMTLEYNEKDEAVWTLPFNKNLTNGMIVHGGAIATMIDNAGWFTIGQYFENWIATVEFTTRLLDFSKNDELIATGHLVKLGKRISTATFLRVERVMSSVRLRFGLSASALVCPPPQGLRRDDLFRNDVWRMSGHCLILDIFQTIWPFPDHQTTS